MEFCKPTHPIKAARSENITSALNQKVLKAETYRETKLPYIEVYQNSEFKYLKNCT